MLFATVFAAFHARLLQPLFFAIKMLGDAFIPLMLFALGVRMVGGSQLQELARQPGQRCCLCARAIGGGPVA